MSYIHDKKKRTFCYSIYDYLGMCFHVSSSHEKCLTTSLTDVNVINYGNAIK